MILILWLFVLLLVLTALAAGDEQDPTIDA